MINLKKELDPFTDKSSVKVNYNFHSIKRKRKIIFILSKHLIFLIIFYLSSFIFITRLQEKRQGKTMRTKTKQLKKTKKILKTWLKNLNENERKI